MSNNHDQHCTTAAASTDRLRPTCHGEHTMTTLDTDTDRQHQAQHAAAAGAACEAPQDAAGAATSAQRAVPDGHASTSARKVADGDDDRLRSGVATPYQAQHAAAGAAPSANQSVMRVVEPLAISASELLERLVERHTVDAVATAVHEAAHIVALRAFFGQAPVYVTLDCTRARNLAHTALGSAVTHPIGLDNTVEGARRSLIVIACGAVAAQCFDPDVDAGDGDDRTQAQSVARRLVGLDAPRDHLLAEMDLGVRRAEAFVPLYWADVVSMAARLLETNTLIEDVVRWDLPLERLGDATPVDDTMTNNGDTT